jgi:flagellar motor switch protein FliN/FliY
MSETIENQPSTQTAQAVPLDVNDLPALHPSKAGGAAIGLDHILDVTVPVTVELGHAKMSIAGLSQLAPGSLITLDREAHESVDILVSGKMIAKGEVVTVGTRYGVRITSMAG